MVPCRIDGVQQFFFEVSCGDSHILHLKPNNPKRNLNKFVLCFFSCTSFLQSEIIFDEHVTRFAEARMGHNFFYAFSNPLQRRRAWLAAARSARTRSSRGASEQLEIGEKIGIAGTCDRVSYTDIIRPLGHASLAVLFMMEQWYHG
jgi:hypothetical protein